LGVRFRVVRSRYRESTPRGLGPAAAAVRHAAGKARGAAVRRGVVIGADTLVFCAGRIWGKPRDRAHARRMLWTFSARPQRVYTGVALLDKASGRLRTFWDASAVEFRPLSEADIERYLGTGEYRDKAGAFGLQGRGRRFIRRVRGSRSNVIGLPLEKLRAELRKFLRA
jgi:septum formation protein